MTSPLIPHTKPVPDKDSKTTKLLEDTIGGYLCDLRMDKHLLNRTQETVTTKENIIH